MNTTVTDPLTGKVIDPSTSNIDNPLTSNLRVATFSIALFDVLQTIPAEIQLYRKQIKNGRMSLVCFLFIVVRYVSIVALVLNGVGFYGSHFTLDECIKFRLAPPVTKMVAGIACQCIIFLRTWAISRKSRPVLIILGVLFVLCLPFLILGNVYARAPYVQNGSCIAKQAKGTLNTAPMYYGAMSAFDVVACAIATYYLMDLSTKSSMSGFTRKVLKHGLIYAFGTTLSNIVVLMAVCHVKYIEKLGAFLSVAITMIMAQHLVLSTQNFNDTTSANYSNTREIPSSGGRPFHGKGFLSDSAKIRPSSSTVVRPHGRHPAGADTFELGVRIQTETHMDSGEDSGARTVDLQRAESRSSMTDASGKGVPVQYDPERGYGQYDDDDTRKYDRDAKPLQ
ncbi:unnamed protein product [Rhizoctonia solani]|uniref:Transmembrane protein n=3 Tax=Rhizoctonia solani TaxID=456999 RepID=A0A8H3A079_9AGAM|nr:transmembrane protein, putative [Rhizoctonia solani AG-3 Rhs1AP]CAE6388871.1 unnamed protein product [Rhizoctonia solani]CAE6528598.1 unnamed protein product [Rhizoctonia solani]